MTDAALFLFIAVQVVGQRRKGAAEAAAQRPR